MYHSENSQDEKGEEEEEEEEVKKKEKSTALMMMMTCCDLAKNKYVNYINEKYSFFLLILSVFNLSS